MLALLMFKPSLALLQPLLVVTVSVTFFFFFSFVRSQPNVQSKPQKEGTESEQFWDLLGGKCEHPNQKIVKVTEGDPHLFSCSFLEGRKYEVSVNGCHFLFLPRIYLFYPKSPIESHKLVFSLKQSQSRWFASRQLRGVYHRFFDIYFLMSRSFTDIPTQNCFLNRN